MTYNYKFDKKIIQIVIRCIICYLNDLLLINSYGNYYSMEYLSNLCMSKHQYVQN